MGVKYMQLWEEMALARKEAKSEGRAEGKAEGESSKLIELICKKLRKGLLSEQIAEHLEEDLATVQSIYEIALPYAPDFDGEKVFEAWMKYEKDSCIIE